MSSLVYSRNPRCYQGKVSSQVLNNLASHLSNLNHSHIKSSLLLRGSPQTCLILPFPTPWSMPFSPDHTQDPILLDYICPITQDSSQMALPEPPPQWDRLCPTSEELYHLLLLVLCMCSTSYYVQCLPFLLYTVSSCSEGVMFYTYFYPAQCPSLCPRTQISKHPFEIIILTVWGQFIMTDIHVVTWNNQLLINHYSPD